MKKIVLLTNILSPYRIAFFDELARQLNEKAISFRVLIMSENESNRKWHYDEYKRDYTLLLKKRYMPGMKDTVFVNTDLISVLEQETPDLLILSGSYTLFPVWRAKSWGRKQSCKLFFWSESHLGENKNLAGIKILIREQIRRFFYQKFDGFLFPGERAKQLICKYNSTAQYYIHVPNLIDNDRFESKYEELVTTSSVDSIRDKYGIEKGIKVLFSPIRLTAVKGMDLFLERIKDIPNKKEFQIVIAGDGELRNKIELIAKRNDINVLILGYQSEESIIELMYASDIFLLPSLSDPSPLSCIEALWCKMPLLISEHVGNADEVLKVGENGYMFNYCKIDSALVQMKKMICFDKVWYSHAQIVSKWIAMHSFSLDKEVARISAEFDAIDSY